MRNCGTSVTEVTHLFFGDEVGRVRDPYGNLWWIQTHIEDVSEEEMTRRLTDPEFTRAMEYVSGGRWPRGSEPAEAFYPDGSAYQGEGPKGNDAFVTGGMSGHSVLPRHECVDVRQVTSW
ncbi:hypothetical protein [Streptomyces sp. NPDC013171]|uniref:hypothetical protein n=1 Tax=Streptomyces sp. NPDC013171 TaxID=3364863 RepID=UPI0036934198